MERLHNTTVIGVSEDIATLSRLRQTNSGLTSSFLACSNRHNLQILPVNNTVILTGQSRNLVDREQVARITNHTLSRLKVSITLDGVTLNIYICNVVEAIRNRCLLTVNELTLVDNVAVVELLLLVVKNNCVCTPVTDVDQSPDVIDLSLVRSISPLGLCRPYIDRTEEAYIEVVLTNQRSIAVVSNLNLNISSKCLVLLTREIGLLLQVTLSIIHTDVVQNVVCRLIHILLVRSKCLVVEQSSTLGTAHPVDSTSLSECADNCRAICNTILLNSDDLILKRSILLVELHSPCCARSTRNSPCTIISGIEVSILTLLRQTEAECNRALTTSELIELSNITMEYNRCIDILVQPVLSQVLGESTYSNTSSTVNLSRCRNVSINLDGIRCIILITSLEVIPVVEHALIDICVCEEDMLLRNIQSHIE